MSRWRIAVVVALLVLPFAVLAGVGSYYLWTLRWGFWAWWPLARCMAAGYLLGLYWQRKKRLLRPAEFEVALHWTERDARAWKLVEAKAKAGADLPPAKLSEIAQYLATAQELAQELAAFYHPGAKDPVGNLTLPEVLAVVELSSHDLAEMVDRYLPGGHLMTINDWKRARQLTDWYGTASNLYWIAGALFDPIQTGLRFAASRVGLTEPWKALQQNLLLWFYTAYVHRLGNYLIELNSGRLRVGATRYRQLLDEVKPPSAPAGPAPPAPPPGEHAPAVTARPVTVTLFGQVKAGKSSLVNALLGERRALTD